MYGEGEGSGRNTDSSMKLGTNIKGTFNSQLPVESDKSIATILSSAVPRPRARANTPPEFPFQHSPSPSALLCPYFP